MVLGPEPWESRSPPEQWCFFVINKNLLYNKKSTNFKDKNNNENTEKYI